MSSAPSSLAASSVTSSVPSVASSAWSEDPSSCPSLSVVPGLGSPCSSTSRVSLSSATSSPPSSRAMPSMVHPVENSARAHTELARQRTRRGFSDHEQSIDIKHLSRQPYAIDARPGASLPTPGKLRTQGEVQDAVLSSSRPTDRLRSKGRVQSGVGHRPHYPGARTQISAHRTRTDLRILRASTIGA